MMETKKLELGTKMATSSTTASCRKKKNIRSLVPPVRGSIKRRIVTILYQNLKLASQLAVHYLLMSNNVNHNHNHSSDVGIIITMLYRKTIHDDKKNWSTQSSIHEERHQRGRQE
ncbi:hypothetical protein I3760_16G019100 [Carya illinoinensis]|nr:hypothetical protein I3760_16G019100 [Carya illinoinensis]